MPERSTTQPKSPRPGLKTLLVGALMVVGGPLFGIGLTIFGVHRSFDAAHGVPPAEKARTVAHGIDTAMTATFVGVAVGVIGAAVVAVGLFQLLSSRQSKPD